MSGGQLQRTSIARALITKGCRLEIVMKDNHTLGNNPQNATRWCQIAQEEAERIIFNLTKGIFLDIINIIYKLIVI